MAKPLGAVRVQKGYLESNGLANETSCSGAIIVMLIIVVYNDLFSKLPIIGHN